MASSANAAILKALPFDQSPLLVWRIENFALVQVPPAAYGTFMQGDSYVVLKQAKGADGSITRKIFFWHGRETSGDEKGASAILAKEMDDALGGSPVQQHEEQGSESDEFKSLFSGGLNFRTGGVASGFKSAALPQKPVKLFIVKSPGPGKLAQVTEVKASTASLVTNASFVMDDDSGRAFYVWHGSSTGLKEKTKALDTANTFRTNRGHFKMSVMDQDDTSSEDARAFYRLLGADDPAAVIASLATCDGLAPAGAALTASGRQTAAQASMYPLGASGLGAAVTPATRTRLDSSSQTLVVCNGRAWLWVGNRSGAALVDAANKAAAGLGVTGGAELVKEHLEPGLFMTCFPDWSSADYAAFQAYQAKTAPAAGFASAGKPVAAAPIDWTEMAKQMVADVQGLLQAGGLPALNTQSSTALPTGGKLMVSVVVGHALTSVAPAEVGHFFAAESYVVLYEYKLPDGTDRQAIYFWQGKQATNTEQGTAALLATDLHNDKYKGTSTLVRVAQQAEPDHLVFLFSGQMLVHAGDRPAAGLPAGGQDVTGPRLYLVKTEGALGALAVEVGAKASSLNTNDIYILKAAGGGVSVWQGAAGNEAELALASTAASHLAAGGAVNVIKEGSEPAEFWSELGGQAAYATQPNSGSSFLYPPVLFHLRDAGKAACIAKPSFTFSQTDLDTVDVLLLEAGNQLFMWCGRESAPTERVRGKSISDAYVAALGRPLNVVAVEEGAEPVFFTQHFPSWDTSAPAAIVDVYAEKLRIKAEQEAAQDAADA